MCAQEQQLNHVINKLSDSHKTQKNGELTKSGREVSEITTSFKSRVPITRFILMVSQSFSIDFLSFMII